MKLTQTELEVFQLLLSNLMPEIKAGTAQVNAKALYELASFGERTTTLDREVFEIMEGLFLADPSLKVHTVTELNMVAGYFGMSILNIFNYFNWLVDDNVAKDLITLDVTSYEPNDWFNDRYFILLLWITSNTLLGEIDDEFTIYGKVFGDGVEPNLVPYNRKIGSMYKTELGFRLGGLASEQDEFIKTKVRYLMEKQNLKAFINTNNSEVYFVSPDNEAKFHRTHFDRMWEFK